MNGNADSFLKMRASYLQWKALPEGADPTIRMLAMNQYFMAMNDALTKAKSSVPVIPPMEEKAAPYFDTSGHKFNSPSELGAHVARSGHPAPHAILNKSSFHGITIVREYSPGETRHGVKYGKKWERLMHNEYGSFPDTKGADGEELDYYMGPNKASMKVFVLNQVRQETGEFDEHKLMLGFDSMEDALAAYLKHYPSGRNVGPIVEKDIEWLKGWMKSSKAERILTKEWLAEKHPRDSDGKFITLDNHSQRRVLAAKETTDALIEYGYAKSIDGEFDPEVIDDLAEALIEMRDAYPFARNLRIKHKDHDIPAFEMVTSHQQGPTLYIYGEANKKGGFEKYAKEFNELISSLPDYKTHLGYKSMESKSRGEKTEAEKFKRYQKMVGEHDIDAPKRAFVAENVKEAVIHELGHLAHFTLGTAGKSLRYGKTEEGHALDERGEFANHVLKPDTLRSAYKMGTYAARDLDEYVAEAFCAYHTGKKDLLDDRTKTMVDKMVERLK